MAHAQVNDLLARWHALRGQGKDASVEQLCAACPELMDDLRERIRDLEGAVPQTAAVGLEIAAEADQASLQTFAANPDSHATVPPPNAEPSADAGAPNLSGYAILGEIGRGGMGVVYRAKDLKRNQLVALKTLQGLNADALYRFKQEFRALADVAHPNLVNLYELVSDGRQWIFTMELIQGVDFLTYVRHSQRRKDPGTALSAEEETRLRSVLRQLAQALVALNDAGKLHRDLKPSNVMVTPEGRVVVLDFGLAATLEASGRYQSVAGQVVGTVAYMSPEQGSGLPVSTATDWYSVGVMLYEVLTGRLPFQGSLYQVLSDKNEKDPPPPRALVPTTPEDLNQLCVELLHRDPHQRPNGGEVVRRLAEGSSSPTTPQAPAPPRPSATLLIGREAHLEALQSAFQTVLKGRTVVLRVHGLSGMGKSSLVQHFLDDLQHSQQAVVLSGRCYQQESVPYKALDTIVDALSRHLAGLEAAKVQALLPRDMQALTRLFPVLRDAASQGSQRSVEIPDARELRRRAFAALRELLARLGDRRPLVLAIDDLQWGDSDSAGLLPDLLRPPDPPLLLLVASYRSEEAAGSKFLTKFLPALAKLVSLDQREQAVERLTPQDATALTLAQLGRADESSKTQAARIARESDGNPLFIHELVQYVNAARQTQATVGEGELRLEDVLWARVCGLPAEARRVLEVLAVSGRPLRQRDAERVADMEGRDYGLPLLRYSRLVRDLGMADHEQIETYHDRVRETILARLEPETRKRWHHRLATTLEHAEHVDADYLAAQFEGAGEATRAAEFYLRAADRAAHALAFDRAARLYRKSMELKPPTPAERRGLYEKLGTALTNAGRGAEAGEAFLNAAEHAETQAALELRRRAGDQLLRSGHVDRGLTIFQDVLKSVGLTYPKTPFRALLHYLWLRARLWLRGLKFNTRSVAEIPAQELLYIDTCWAIAIGLSPVDPIRGMVFQFRHLLKALKAGEPNRVARAVALEIVNSSFSGRNRSKTERLHKLASDLVRNLDNPHAEAITAMCAGTAAFLYGDWLKARQLCEQAEQILRSRCTGVTWELHTAKFHLIRAHEFLGNWAEMDRLYPIYLKEAREQGDVYSYTNLRIRVGYLSQLMKDNPDGARQEFSRGMADWPNQGVHLQHYFEVMAHTDVFHYQGNAKAAWAFVSLRWMELSRSLLLRVQSSRITMHHLRARAALALAAEGSTDPSVPTLLSAAESDTRCIERDDMAWSNPIAALLRAGIAATRGDLAGAGRFLIQAEKGFADADMQLYVQVTRWRRGQLNSDPGLIEHARKWMEQQCIRRPDRIVAMYAPGFDRV